VEKIIAKERPDAILPTMGGQTALNCALDLAKHGVLEKFGVEMIGASREAIDKAEDREKFKQAMNKIGLSSARSAIAHSMEEALQVQAALGFPVVIRPSFTLGGSGGGIVANEGEYLDRVRGGLRASPIGQVIVEKYLDGWQEVEYEVMRDADDTCIAVCSMENVDPLGIHTGDSIVVAPVQTLTDQVHQRLRSAALAIIRALGVEGGCNVQFALSPDSTEYAVIEVNPRVSRSSGPVRVNAATEYPADVRTLKARSPLSTGACSSRSSGRAVSRYSLTACCAQNPADEITNSRPGLTGSCVIAKNGMGPKVTFLTPGFTPFAKSAATCADS